MQQGVSETEPIRRPLRSGQLVEGRYRIDALIARGGQALIYRAIQETLDRTVALKVISRGIENLEPEDDRFKERFQLEARTLANLNHPHIVRIYDFGPIRRDAFYFAMEYIEGASMSQVIRKQDMSRGEAMRLVCQVLRALHYAHEQGVIHRDMKFSNILISTNARGEREAKVIDFGIAKVSDTGDGITQNGDLLGSPYFMSPEQISDTSLDRRTDIYAIGIMLYKIVSGRYPFRADNPQIILAGHLMRQPDPITMDESEAPVAPELEAIIRRCLEKEASKRFDSAEELAVALEPFVDDPSLVPRRNSLDEASPSLPDGHTLAGDPSTSTAFREERWALLGAIGVLTIAILSITAYLAWGDWEQSADERSEITEEGTTSPDATESTPDEVPEPSRVPSTGRSETTESESSTSSIEPETDSSKSEVTTNAPPRATEEVEQVPPRTERERSANTEPSLQAESIGTETPDPVEDERVDSEVAWPAGPPEVIDPWNEE